MDTWSRLKYDKRLISDARIKKEKIRPNIKQSLGALRTQNSERFCQIQLGLSIPGIFLSISKISKLIIGQSLKKKKKLEKTARCQSTSMMSML